MSGQVHSWVRFTPAVFGKILLGFGFHSYESKELHENLVYYVIKSLIWLWRKKWRHYGLKMESREERVSLKSLGNRWEKLQEFEKNIEIYKYGDKETYRRRFDCRSAKSWRVRSSVSPLISMPHMCQGSRKTWDMKKPWELKQYIMD